LAPEIPLVSGAKYFLFSSETFNINDVIVIIEIGVQEKKEAGLEMPILLFVLCSAAIFLILPFIVSILAVLMTIVFLLGIIMMLAHILTGGNSK
jgi:hypothetical protein